MTERRPSYGGDHVRVRKARGRAAAQRCEVCDQPAKDWAHIHGTDPANPANYRPMCRQHHVNYDRTAKAPEYRLTPEHRAKISAAKATLSAEVVRAIYADPRTHRVIAAEYGVSRRTVGKIKTNQSYPGIERTP